MTMTTQEDTTMTMANEQTYHVTSIRNGTVYGHADSQCDPSGCAAGSEVRIGEYREDVEVGRIYWFDGDGHATAELYEEVRS